MRTILLFMLMSAASCLAQTGRTPNMVQTESVNRIGIYGGMGVHGTFAPSVADHLNGVSRSASEVGSIATSVEFFGGIEVPVSPAWALKAEHSLLFKSYTLEATIYGREELRYDVQAPMLMAQYVIPGRGYFIKFGAGGGWHWGKIRVHTSIYGEETIYTASGIGGRAEAEGQTAFDSHLFGYISGSIGFEALGRVRSDRGMSLTDGNTSVSLNYFTAGVRFGLMYYF
ncbi:MAG: hypothetical protein ACM3Q4_04925 [Acidobacteriota bacterium]